MIPVPLYFVGTSNLHLKIFGKSDTYEQILFSGGGV